METAANEQRRRVAGVPFPKGMSGNPKGKALVLARAAELFEIMAVDFADLSAVDNVMLRQACLLLARAERIHRVRDVDVAMRMSGEARRLLMALRPKRKASQAAQPQSLAEYLSATYGGDGAPASDSGAPVAQSSDEAAEEPSRRERTSGAANGPGEAAE
jgi:hypothetical protein